MRSSAQPVDSLIVGKLNRYIARIKSAVRAILTQAFKIRAPIDRYLRTNNVRPRIAIEANSADLRPK